MIQIRIFRFSLTRLVHNFVHHKLWCMLQRRTIFLIIPGKRIKSVLASQSMLKLSFCSKGSLLVWILCFFSLSLLLFWFHNEPREIPFVPKPVSSCQARFLNHIFYLYVMEACEDRIYYWEKNLANVVHTHWNEPKIERRRKAVTLANLILVST